MENPYNTILKVCSQIDLGNDSKAREIIQEEYPFKLHEKTARKIKDSQAFSIFKRDHFIDQYSGDRLIYIPTLRIINWKLKDDVFPYHPHGKMSKCHIAFWELIPSLDHVIPLARNGKDEEENIVTTSMLKNSIKANWTLKELGWKKIEVKNLPNWDGLVNWYIDFYQKNISDLRPLPNYSYFKHWYDIASNPK